MRLQSGERPPTVIAFGRPGGNARFSSRSGMLSVFQIACALGPKHTDRQNM